jgi:GalNAc-alpha-(1->4)-GalNAc-alpha-(1->3)-diNAcBac-PP-undecaprenol alpha-1,4-N-acetyl-D-galactosaminyltransferase
MKKKITLILPTLHSGGMERVISILGNQFVDYENVQVDLILFSVDPKVFYVLDNRINVHTNQSWKKKSLKLFVFLQTLSFVRKEIDKISPDAILSFGTQWNNLVLLSLIGKKYKIFVSDRGSPTRTYSFHQELLKNVLYPRASGIVTQTSFSEKVTRQRFRNSNIITIGNPIRCVEHDSEKFNHILSVGRLIDSKNHDKLIKIFEKLKGAEDWKLIIVGGDALKQSNHMKLIELISDLKLQNRVVLTGEQPNVDEYYASSRIFAFTSSIEGFPNVIGEALSSGLPVVSYNCVAGPSEMIINDFNGFLVPLFDNDDFLQKLQFLINSDAERARMSNNAFGIRDKFSAETISRNFFSFLINENSSN